MRSTRVLHPSAASSPARAAAEAADTWAWLIIAARTQLFLARHLTADSSV